MLTANDRANVNSRLIRQPRPGGSNLNYNFRFRLDRRNDVALKVGDLAPDFELPAIAGDRQIMIRSRDYLGRQNLVVAFHPIDWTPT
jgi:hypothetical protein